MTVEYPEIENCARAYVDAGWDPKDPANVSEIMYDLNVSRDEAEMIIERMSELVG